MPRPHMPLILLPYFSPAFLAFPAPFTGVFRHAPFAFTSPRLSRSLLPASLSAFPASSSAPSAAACGLSRAFPQLTPRGSTLFPRGATSATRLPSPKAFCSVLPSCPCGDLRTQKSRPPEGRRPCINAGGALLRVCSVYLEAASARAATAGRVLPSSTSRKAPPPVER